MKKRNLILKSAVCIALSAGALSAQAGTLYTANAPAKSYNFATHVFGTASESTPVYTPDLYLTSAGNGGATIVPAGVNAVAATPSTSVGGVSTSIYRLQLTSGATFSDDIRDDSRYREAHPTTGVSATTRAYALSQSDVVLIDKTTGTRKPFCNITISSGRSGDDSVTLAVQSTGDIDGSGAISNGTAADLNGDGVAGAAADNALLSGLGLTTGAGNEGNCAGVATGDIIFIRLATDALGDEQVQINNATSQLKTAGGVIRMTVSPVSGINDVVPAVTVAISEDPFASTFTTNAANPNLTNTINTADSDKLFSKNIPTAPTTATVGNDGSTAFTSPGQVFNVVGQVNLRLKTATNSLAGLSNGTLFNNNGVFTVQSINGNLTNYTQTPATQISDEDGAIYGVTPEDTLVLTLTPSVASGFAAFAHANGIFLDNPGLGCPVSYAASVSGTTAGVIGKRAATTVSASTATITMSGSDVTAGGGLTFDVCLNADGTTAILPMTVSASYLYTNIEDDYQAATYSGTIGTLIRNGCLADYHNVPNKNDSHDQVFLRLANKTNLSGPVRLTAWNQDGTQLGAAAVLVSATPLAAHATMVIDAPTIETLLGLTAAWANRIRVSLVGGFGICEGQALVRDKVSGELLNNSATVGDGQRVTITANGAGHNGL